MQQKYIMSQSSNKFFKMLFQYRAWWVTSEQSLTAVHTPISIFDVLNNFIKNLLNVKSSDCIDLLSKVAYI